MLRKLLREGDSLVVDAIDRLGRKKSDIKSEVEYLRSKKVRLIVLSLPTTTIDPGQGQEWVLDMVTNLLIEVYASIAEQELVEKERRTRAGIEIAKSEGKYKGRKPIEYDGQQLEKCYSRWKSGVIKTSEFQKLLGLKPNTFYRAIVGYINYIASCAAPTLDERLKFEIVRDFLNGENDALSHLDTKDK